MNSSTRQHPPIFNPEKIPAGCTCGKGHPTPLVTLYSGADAARILAEDCRELYRDRPVFLLSDPETEVVAGRSLREQLLKNQIVLESCLLDPEPSATESLAEKIRSASQTKALIIGVGSGTINDLGKFAADRNRIDYWSLPTAPSMNGYTSSIAAIKVNGVKRTLPAAPPQRIYAIPQVIQEAPLKLRQAGFCDVLAKGVSDIDWQCESLLQSHSYCNLPSALLSEVEASYARQPEEIGRGEQSAVMNLFHGLLISGVAMSLAGSSAPASGGEHLVSHFWDMREVLTGRKPELHGLQVGVGILFSAACYAQLARCTGADLAADAAQSLAASAEKIREIWGELADEVNIQFDNKRAVLMQFGTLLPQNWETLQPLCAQVAAPEYFADLFARTGAPLTLAALRLTVEEFRLAALHARSIRERITVLDLAAHAGVLDAAVEETLHLL